MVLNTWTSTTGAMQAGIGSVTIWSIWALPAVLRKDGVTATTGAAAAPPLPPHTSVAPTIVTGPVVPAEPPVPMSRPLTSTWTRPLEDTDASPLFTTHGAPPLETPPIIWPGVEPITLDSNDPLLPSSASALNEKTNTALAPIICNVFNRVDVLQELVTQRCTPEVNSISRPMVQRTNGW